MPRQLRRRCHHARAAVRRIIQNRARGCRRRRQRAQRQDHRRLNFRGAVLRAKRSQRCAAPGHAGQWLLRCRCQRIDGSHYQLGCFGARHAPQLRRQQRPPQRVVLPPKFKRERNDFRQRLVRQPAAKAQRQNRQVQLQRQVYQHGAHALHALRAAGRLLALHMQVQGVRRGALRCAVGCHQVQEGFRPLARKQQLRVYQHAAPRLAPQKVRQAPHPAGRMLCARHGRHRQPGPAHKHIRQQHGLHRRLMVGADYKRAPLQLLQQLRLHQPEVAHVVAAQRQRKVVQKFSVEKIGAGGGQPLHLPRCLHMLRIARTARAQRPRLQRKVRARGQRVRSVQCHRRRMHLQRMRHMFLGGDRRRQLRHGQRRSNAKDGLQLPRHPLVARKLRCAAAANCAVKAAKADGLVRSAAHKRAPRAKLRARKRQRIQQRKLQRQVAPHRRPHNELHINHRRRAAVRLRLRPDLAAHHALRRRWPVKAHALHAARQPVPLRAQQREPLRQPAQWHRMRAAIQQRRMNNAHRQRARARIHHGRGARRRTAQLAQHLERRPVRCLAAFVGVGNQRRIQCRQRCRRRAVLRAPRQRGCAHFIVA